MSSDKLLPPINCLHSLSMACYRILSLSMILISLVTPDDRKLWRLYCLLHPEYDNCNRIPIILHSSNSHNPKDPFREEAGLVSRNTSKKSRDSSNYYHQPIDLSHFSPDNHWGFTEIQSEEERQAKYRENLKSLAKELDKAATAKPEPETTLPPDPEHNGLLKDVGNIGVGFGVGVGVPGNDPVSVGTRFGLDLGASGLAGKLPVGQDIFPRQGENISLNDYDGNKDLIVSGKWGKYWTAVLNGDIKIPQYQPVKSLVGVNSGIGIG